LVLRLAREPSRRFLSSVLPASDGGVNHRELVGLFFASARNLASAGLRVS
jgi:hypothetical protein